MASEADDIAQAVLDQFRKLPAKRKPAVRDNGLREWVPLSGIVVRGPNFFKCVALATGMKCLPAAKLSQANGVAIHDWHAEVLVIRAFNRFLLDECRRLAQDPAAESEFLRRRVAAELSPTISAAEPWHGQPFAWRDELTLHMYCSEAPCGDASMELIMSSQEDATPWENPPTFSSPSPSPHHHHHQQQQQPLQQQQQQQQQQGQRPSQEEEAHLLLGRGYFSHLGIVRRKPARADAPPTLSKSCSDKLALRQCVSLLSSPTALLVSPRGVYLSTLVLPASQHVEGACVRCFSGNDGGGGESSGGSGSGSDGRIAGRMAPLRGKTWQGTGYEFREMSISATEREFEYSRRRILAAAAAAAAATGGEEEEAVAKVKLAASNLAVAWTKDGEVDEGLVGGVLQGRKAFDLRGASAASRRRLWSRAAEVAALLGPEHAEIRGALAKATYGEVKESEALEGRRRVKEEVRREALKGWVRNTGDEGFSLVNQAASAVCGRHSLTARHRHDRESQQAA
ncbi:hypothetical protein VTJ83DRAFT_3887 [Remersonia thermophila]|uniref:A to I editase domain-containing protein n=1 Tax=Remersonia thermophila TaxID=72144 RepID=A0ABR4DFB5_9PEZI